MKQFVILVLFLMGFNYAHTCSCIYISEYFCPTMNWLAPYAEQNPIFIVKAKVLSINGSLMEVKVTENIFEEITDEEITVIGQDGLNCNQWLEVFEAGQEVILAVSEAYQQDKYNLSACGRFYLHVEEDNVIGPISNESNSQPYADFRNGIADCFQITDTENPVPETEISIFPNPCNDQLHINFSESRKPSQIFLLNANGQVMKKMSSESRSENLDLSVYPSGLYFVKVIQGDRVFSEKVVKV